MKSSLAASLVILSLLCCGRSAQATIIVGVEFTDALVFEIPFGAVFALSTSEDIYVFAAVPIVADIIDITVGGGIILAQSITATTLNLAQGSAGSLFDFDRDVIVKLPQPIGDLTLLAGGSVVIAAQEIAELSAVPEPATALLLTFGLFLTAAGWRTTRRNTAGTRRWDVSEPIGARSYA